MKKIITYLCIVSIFFSCASNDDSIIEPLEQNDPINPPAPISIVGKYKNLSSNYDHDINAEIDEENISLFGTVGDYATRSRGDIPYTKLNDSTLLIINKEFPFSWENDILTIYYEGIPEYVFKIDTSIPDANDWVTLVVPEFMVLQDSFSTETIKDLTFYEGHVYTNAHENLNGDTVITKINVENGSIEQLPISTSVSTILRSKNITYNSNDRFLVSHSISHRNIALFEFDPTFSTPTSTTPIGNGNVNTNHIGSDGINLWVNHYNNISKYDPVNHEWGEIIDLGIRPIKGIDVDNNYLYLGISNTIQRYTQDPLNAIAAYDIFGDNVYALYGFTFISENEVIASVYNISIFKYEIVKITLP